MTDLNESCAPLRASDFCVEAARLVAGPRNMTHGDKEINFECTALLWEAYLIARSLSDTSEPGWRLDAIDVGNMMELMKIARRLNGTFNADDYVDAAGYAGCTGEIAAKRNV